MRTIEAIHYGGPDTLSLRERPTPQPGAAQALVRVEASGVNYIDVYHRSGLYPTSEPVRLGLEGAGVVEALGPDVRDFKVGDRVAWCSVPGSYASHVCAPTQQLVPIPPGLSSQNAAAALLQGMTAHFLTHDTCPLKPGDTCLVHAAAGGVGALLCQMAKARGARVLATVSNEAKAEVARQAGADAVILYSSQDFAQEVSTLTGGRGVRVVYDSVGKDTWERGIQCLAPRGMLVLFGQSSGPVPPIDPLVLSRRGSLFLTRPTLFHHVATREELVERARALWDLLLSGAVSVRVARTFALEEAQAAHRFLEARAALGKILLIP